MHKASKQNSSPSHWIQRQLITVITREMLQTWALEEKRRFHHLGSKFLFSYLEVQCLTVASGLFHKDKCTMNTLDSQDIVFDWLDWLIDWWVICPTESCFRFAFSQYMGGSGRLFWSWCPAAWFLHIRFNSSWGAVVFPVQSHLMLIAWRSFWVLFSPWCFNSDLSNLSFVLSIY